MPSLGVGDHDDDWPAAMAERVWNQRDELKGDTPLSKRPLDELGLDDSFVHLIRTCPMEICESRFRGRLRQLESRT